MLQQGFLNILVKRLRCMSRLEMDTNLCDIAQSLADFGIAVAAPTNAFSVCYGFYLG
jgi:hypothetical protein